MSYYAKAVNKNAKFLDIGHLVRSVIAFVLAALLVGAAGPVLAAKSTAHPRTDALFQASEIAENLSESSPSIDAAAFDKAMSDIDSLDPRLAKTLSPDRKQALDTLVTAMRSAWTRADRSAMGVQAIDAFRLLQEAMPRGPKAIPVQVDCWESRETKPLFSSETDPPYLRVDYTASVDKSSGLVPGSPFFAGFLVGDLRLDSLCRNRQESLPVSTMWQ